MAPTAGTAGDVAVLVGDDVLNGSFETGLRPWTSRATRGITEHYADAVAQAGAPQGEHVLVLRTVNEDGQRNGASVSLTLKTVDAKLGNKYRLTWKARTRSVNEFARVAGRIIFKLADGTTSTGGRVLMQHLSEEWTDYTQEFLITESSEVVSASVNIGVLRGNGANPLECEAYIDAVGLEQMPGPVVLNMAELPVDAEPIGEAPRNPIPVVFELKRASEVTLVIEDESGNRVRNLVSGEHFEAGSHTVWWDGFDEGVPVTVSGSASQRVERSPVKTGTYNVRGLARDPIKLTYDFTVLPNVGNPPWPTSLADGNGGWLGDHGTPAGVGYIPANIAPGGVEQMLLTSTVAESAQSVAWVDLQGNKLAGRHHFGGTWTGASHVSADLGPKRNSDVYLYTYMPWTNKQGREVRIMGLTKDGPLSVGKISHPEYVGEIDPKSGNPLELGIEGGMAVHDGLLVYSLFGPDRLYFMDVNGLSAAQQGKPLGEAAVNKPHGLAFTRDGALLVLSDRQVLRYEIGTFPNPLSKPEVVIAEGLEEPRSITVDADDNIYIGDWGQSHQVKVFNAKGKFVSALGKPGVPHSGAFDPQHMNNPFGVAVTPSGQVWVTMRPWRNPKTVAVWKTDGTFVRNFYGPTAYGGGGFIDPRDGNRFLYSESKQGGTEFTIDWKTGRAEPTRVYWLSSETPVYQPARWLGPMFPRHIDGRAYITNEFAGPTSGARLLTLWKDNPPESMRATAFVGAVAHWPGLEELLTARFPEWSDKSPAKRFRFQQTMIIAWSDANGDGLRQEEECEFRSLADEPGFGLVKATTLAGDSFKVLITHESGVYSLNPYKVEDGVPYYHLSDLKPEASGLIYDGVRSSVRVQALQSADGTLITTGGPMMGVKDGQAKWIYHSQWPSLHVGHASPRLPEYPGQLLATTRLLGPLVKPLKGDAGELWAINSDRGVVYLLTADGLYVDTLFAYSGEGESARWDMPNAKRGMDLTNVNTIDEHFFPSINQLPDGSICLVAGKSHSSLVRLDGLDSVRRFVAAPIEIDADAERAIHAHSEQMARWSRKQDGGDVALIARVAKSPKIDGQLDDWPVVQWLPVGKGRITRGFRANDVVWSSVALAVDNQNLYVAVRTRQKKLLGNSGANPQTIFTTGGGLDLSLSTRPVPAAAGKEPQIGDVRLVIAQVGDQPIAIRFRPKVPGTTQPVVYESTVAHTEIDRVDDVSGDIALATSKVTLTAQNGGLMGAGDFDQFEIAIPLTTLDWSPADLPVTRGDVGVLIGKPGATQERVYWHNLATGLVSDMPSEARLEPHMWGEFRLHTR